MQQPKYGELKHAGPVATHGIPLVGRFICINTISLADISVRYIGANDLSIGHPFAGGQPVVHEPPVLPGLCGLSRTRR
jgi:hypothetical protein